VKTYNLEIKMSSIIPVDNLLGLTLENDWKVIEKITENPKGTGGSFSSGYKVKKADKVAYLKALDFSEAFGSLDPPRRLQELTEAYNFERDLLIKCRDRKLSKVIHPLCDGSIQVPGLPEGIGRVYYLIFDLADGDIRYVKDTFKKLNIAFVFRSLHNTAVGLEQLHKIEIAHQDLKPSNVLVFKDESKITDLGRAADKNNGFVYDSIEMPGDRNYSPIEQYYKFHFSGDFTEKYAGDMYLLGSLFFFFFTGMTATQTFFLKTRSLHIKLTNVFTQDLPELKYVFNEMLRDFFVTISKIMNNKNSSETINLIKTLCFPDPRERGESTGNRYSLERTISKLDLLARRAEVELNE